MDKNSRIGLAFAQKFYEGFVKEGSDPFIMLDDDTVYTTGEGGAAAFQHAVVGRDKINLDMEMSVLRNKELRLTSVDTQGTVDDGLLVLVHGAAVDPAHPQNSKSFVQTFFLGSEDGFFIRNSIIRFYPNTVAAVPAAAGAVAPVAVADNAAAAAAAPVVATKQADAAAPAKKGSRKEKQQQQQQQQEVAQKQETPQKQQQAPQQVSEAQKKTPSPSPPKQSEVDKSKKSAAAAAAAAAAIPAETKDEKPASFLDAARRNAKEPAPAGVKKEKKVRAAAAATAATTAAAPAPNAAAAAAAAEKGNNKKGNNNNNNNNNNAGGEKGKQNNGQKDGSKDNKEKKKSKKESDEKNRINPNAQCYVSNIGFTTTDEALLALLSSFGKIKEIVRPQSMGYGFVQFADDNDARKAITNPNNVNLTLDGRELKIEERTGKANAGSKEGKQRAPRKNNNKQ